MDINKETEKQIQELQTLEQNLQNIILQKQSFQLEQSETENALEEVEKSKEDIFKIAGNIMIKGSKEEILKELKQKKDVLSLRLKSLDSQEESLSTTTEELREKVLSKIQK